MFFGDMWNFDRLNQWMVVIINVQITTRQNVQLESCRICGRFVGYIVVITLKLGAYRNHHIT